VKHIGVGLITASVVSVLMLIFTPSARELDYWTGYYAFRTNVSVRYVSFSDGGPCFRSERDSTNDYNLTYSTSVECGLETERTRARRALCSIRMAKPDGSSRSRSVEGCMKWYDN